MLAAAIGLAASASAATLNLSTVTTDTTIADGTLVTDALGSNVKLSIAAGATITLNQAQIYGNSFSSYPWAGLTCLGDATIILVNENEIVGFSSYYPGIYVPAGCTLTIKGSGNLAVQSNGTGAGIGSANIYAGECTSCGNIVIEGGTINARSPDNGAGIGSGYDGSSCGNIMILGGTITARSGRYGAGIGSGANGSSCGSIAIVGGTVQATGRGGIGSGSWGSSCGDILIGSGVSSVLANGQGGSDSIGAGGQGSTCGTVAISKDLMCVGGVKSSTINIRHISGVQNDISLVNGSVLTGTLAANVRVSIADGATVTLRDVNINGVNNSSYKWAGITCEGDATIILEGANTVKGFYENYPGIYVPESKTLTIKGSGSLNARSNGYGAGIGAAYAQTGSCGSIIIEGGSIVAVGGSMGAAGIGSCYGSSCGNISITGGTVVSTGGAAAAGIGCGAEGRCGDITIAKTVERVTATGGAADYGYGAGKSIGLDGSTRGTCGTVTIGGIVTGSIAESPYTYPEQLVDLSGLSGAYTAQDGDTLRGETEYAVTIPGGATVTVNGVSITGAAGGTVLPSPAFAADGKAATTEFVKGENGKWTLTTFAEMSNDALGSGVANGQIKVYAAPTVEGLNNASPMTSGVTVKGKKSAVMTTIEVTPPGNPDSQFFKVKFGN